LLEVKATTIQLASEISMGSSRSEYLTHNSPKFLISIGYEDKYTEESLHPKFLGLQNDSHLNWKIHIDQLVKKLSRACCAVTSLSHISKIDTVKKIYFAYFHSLMKYGIIIWGNSSDSKKVFTLHKKIIKIIAGTNLKLLVETYLRSYRSYRFHANIYSH
jgi:Na+/glutamate symporter